MKQSMKLRMGLSAGAIALVAAAGLTVGQAAFAQSSNPPQATATAPQHGGKGFGGAFFGRGSARITTIAKALNMTEADLQTALQSGKSVSEVAASKNVSLDTVVNAIITDETATLKQAVTDGRLTQAQADTRLANLKVTLPGQLQTHMVAGFGNDGQRGPGGLRGVGGATLTIVAKSLNMNVTDLQTQLQSGKTIADVAKSKNVDLATISAAILADEKTRVAQAVTAGKLTQAQADQLLANASTRINDFLNGKLPQGGPGRGRGAFGGPGRNSGGTQGGSLTATPQPGA